MIRVQADAVSVADMNSKLASDSNPQEGLVQLRNLMDAIIAGAIDAQVDCAVRATTQSVTAQGGGEDSSYNLK